MNFIEQSLQQLLEMSQADLKLCNCGHTDSTDIEDHKAYCKALKKAKGFSSIAEGQSKRKAEDTIEKLCTCEGGMSLDPADHETTCPAYKKLQDGDYSSDDIDAAEYQFGKDR